MSIARTATGLEGALLIHPDGTLVTSSSMTFIFGEMKQFLVPPEDDRWVKLDGKEVDVKKHSKLASTLGRGDKLPEVAYMWVYAG